MVKLTKSYSYPTDKPRIAGHIQLTDAIIFNALSRAAFSHIADVERAAKRKAETTALINASRRAAELRLRFTALV